MNFIFEWSTRYLTSECSERERYGVEHEKIKFISISGHVIFYLLYKHKWNTKPFHFNIFNVEAKARFILCNHNDGDLFTCEDNLLSSRVRIRRFRGKAHLVFFWCLYNKIISQTHVCFCSARSHSTRQCHTLLSNSNGNLQVHFLLSP